MGNKKLYTEAEAANYLGFTAEALRSSRYTKILAGVKPPIHCRIGTKSIRYLHDDLEKWVTENARRLEPKLENSDS